MMRARVGWLSLAVTMMANGPVCAANIVVMTPTSVNAALAAVQPGDTLRMEGVFTTSMLWRNRDFGGVTVDASAATIQAGLRLGNVHNIHFTGGVWQPSGSGDAIRVENSSHVSFINGTVLGQGDKLGSGTRIWRSSFVTVRDSRYVGLRNNVMLLSSTDSLVTGNRYENGGEDGMKIVDSQRIIASHNSCTGFTPLPGYHPDCIQLWSTVGNPVQSDIYILNNLAIGPQQGFASFDPDTLSGTRLTFAGNFAATTGGHTITCLGCFESRFEDNVMVTLPDAQWLAPLRVTGPATGNIFSGNIYIDLRGMPDAPLPDRIGSQLTPSIAGLVGSQWANRSHLAAALNDGGAGVPEPASWAMLILGFGVIGSRLRQRRTPQQACA